MNATTRKLLLPFIAIALTLFAACGGQTDDSNDQPTKAEVARQAADGKADADVDWCDVLDWYDDGICDTFCAKPDPDCAESTYEPCGAKTCGDSCTLCEPGDPDCFETAVVKQCQPDGSCDAAVPMCGGDDDDGDDDTYEPCGDLTCGDSCTICDPSDPDCVETAEVKQCQPDGTCAANVPVCEDDAYDPCDGKMCGDSCTLCEPGDPDCYETAVPKQCQADGSCDAAAPMCGGDDDDGDDDAYDPCDGKMCGDLCTICDPNDPDCVETAVVKQCDAQGTCSASAPTCN